MCVFSSPSSLGIPLWSGPGSAEELREISRFERSQHVWMHALHTVQLPFSARIKRHHPYRIEIAALVNNSSFIRKLDADHERVRRHVSAALTLITKSWKTSCTEAATIGGIFFLLMSGLLILSYFHDPARDEDRDIPLGTFPGWPAAFALLAVATTLGVCTGFWCPRLDQKKLQELYRIEIDFIEGYSNALAEELSANPAAEELQSLAAHFQWIRSRERIANVVEENYLDLKERMD